VSDRSTVSGCDRRDGGGVLDVGVQQQCRVPNVAEGRHERLDSGACGVTVWR
jgi:hypothetical protein